MAGVLLFLLATGFAAWLYVRQRRRGRAEPEAPQPRGQAPEQGKLQPHAEVEVDDGEQLLPAFQHRQPSKEARLLPVKEQQPLSGDQVHEVLRRTEFTRRNNRPRGQEGSSRHARTLSVHVVPMPE